MDKMRNTAAKTWHWLRYVRLQYLLLMTLIVFWGSAALLRRNNLQMVRLRDAVVKADADGTDVREPLQKLRDYVGRHMNTNLRSSGEFSANEPPVQLVNSYNRAVQAAQQAAAQASGNQELYAEAEASCKSRAVPLTIIATCIQQYVAARTNDSTTISVASVRKELYSYDFVSPRWSPDVAGWSVVLAGLVALVFIYRLSREILLPYLLQKRN